MKEKYFSIRIAKQLEKKWSLLAPRVNLTLFRSTCEVTFPWRLVHKRLMLYFQNFNFNQFQKRASIKVYKYQFCLQSIKA